jgi:Domain of unknown function (DUF4139)
MSSILDFVSLGNYKEFYRVCLSFLCLRLCILSVTKTGWRIAHVGEGGFNRLSFISGPVAIYIDDAFVATTSFGIPSVMPGESFDLPVGVDPSIRIDAHPVIRKTTTNAASFVGAKQRVQSVLQRYSVGNKKSVGLDNLALHDRIPVSEDGAISVKLVEPPIDRVSKDGVKAEWEDEKEGKIKLNLGQLDPGEEKDVSVRFEVSWPTSLDIVGL